MIALAPDGVHPTTLLDEKDSAEYVRSQGNSAEFNRRMGDFRNNLEKSKRLKKAVPQDLSSVQSGNIGSVLSEPTISEEKDGNKG